MNAAPPVLQRRPGSLLLSAILWLMAGAGNVSALDILRLDKSTSIDRASVASGQVFTFRIRYNCASTSESALNAKITDVLDSNLELISLQGSAHTITAGYDVATSTVKFTFVSPLTAGSTGEVFIQARFKSTTPENTVSPNTATFTADNADTQTSNQVTVTATDAFTQGNAPVPPPPPAVVPGVSGNKWGPSEITSLGPYLSYEIRHGNTGSTSLASYSVLDPLPPGTSLAYFGTDRWIGTKVPVTVWYRTNILGLWLPWGLGPLYNTGEARRWFYADEITLQPLEWITGLRFDYGTLPGDGSFKPSAMVENLQVVAYMRNPSSFSAGTTIVNQATISAAGYSTTATASTNVTPATPQPYLDIASAGTHAPPYAIGETFQSQVHLGVGNASSTGMTNPVIYMLVPPQFEFRDWRIRWWPSGSSNTAPDFSKITNFGAKDQTLLIFSWQRGRNLTIPANRTWNEVMVEADLRVNSRTPNGDYTVKSWAEWKTPAMDTGSQIYTSDTLDLDSDGSMVERLAYDATNVAVKTGNGVAGLESTMFVRGELDPAWTKFPAIGQTVPGGKADYELRIRNIGGIVMRDAVVVDILPTVGDTGVIDLTPRGSLWSPFLVDAVTAPAGVTVYYSTSKNPCRPELVPSGPPGCEAPGWSSTVPDDITTVRSLKFDFTGLELFPGDEITLTWPMRAPWGAPTAGEVSWNSFGFTAVRADNNNPLLASEPLKTGISIQRPAPPYYGDFVWMDTNKNGLQDSGEAGINGVRVELFRDNGDNIADPAADTMVAFTATYRDRGRDGAYLFGNMGPGDYYAVILAPTDTGVTSPNKAPEDRDSDGTSIIYKNRRAAVMPVTKLDTLEEDRTWDQGFYNRGGIPAVWAVAHLPDGSMYIGGKFAKSHGVARNNIARLTASGGVDTAFNPGSGFDGPVRTIAVRNDGMIWVGGNFSRYNGSPCRGVALLHPNGSFDSRPAKPDTQEVHWVASDSSGMYLAGAFGKVGGIPRGNFARLKMDGGVDVFFAPGPGANGTIFGGALLPGGQIVLVGAFTQFNGVSRRGIVRLKPDGTVDLTFDPRSGASGEVYSLKVFEDGRMVLTGNFRSFNGVPCNGTVRLLRDGAVDDTLRPSALNVESINSSH